MSSRSRSRCTVPPRPLSRARATRDLPSKAKAPPVRVASSAQPGELAQVVTALDADVDVDVANLVAGDELERGNGRVVQVDDVSPLRLPPGASASRQGAAPSERSTDAR